MFLFKTKRHIFQGSIITIKQPLQPPPLPKPPPPPLSPCLPRLPCQPCFTTIRTTTTPRCHTSSLRNYFFYVRPPPLYGRVGPVKCGLGLLLRVWTTGVAQNPGPCGLRLLDFVVKTPSLNPQVGFGLGPIRPYPLFYKCRIFLLGAFSTHRLCRFKNGFFFLLIWTATPLWSRWKGKVGPSPLVLGKNRDQCNVSRICILCLHTKNSKFGIFFEEIGLKKYLIMSWLAELHIRNYKSWVVSCGKNIFVILETV
jgi:hypothetical protein